MRRLTGICECKGGQAAAPCLDMKRSSHTPCVRVLRARLGCPSRPATALPEMGRIPVCNQILAIAIIARAAGPSTHLDGGPELPLVLLHQRLCQRVHIQQALLAHVAQH